MPTIPELQSGLAAAITDNTNGENTAARVREFLESVIQFLEDNDVALTVSDITDFPQILIDLGTAADEAARLAVLGITDDPWTDGALRIGNDEGGADDITPNGVLGLVFAELDSADQTTGTDETLAWSASAPEDRLTVTASINILNATGFDGKGAHILTVIQDATGGRAITFNATNFEAHNGADLTENDAANAITVYVLLDVGTSKIQVFKAG